MEPQLPDRRRINPAQIWSLIQESFEEYAKTVFELLGKYKVKNRRLTSILRIFTHFLLSFLLTSLFLQTKESRLLSKL
jgi:hypothetical protein